MGWGRVGGCWDGALAANYRGVRAGPSKWRESCLLTPSPLVTSSSRRVQPPPSSLGSPSPDAHWHLWVSGVQAGALGKVPQPGKRKLPP